MSANINQVELIVGLLWVGFAVVALSPITLLFFGRPRRPRYADIGPSGELLAPALKHLSAAHSAKPPPQAGPLATA
jgi:hypothetical protein